MSFDYEVDKITVTYDNAMSGDQNPVLTAKLIVKKSKDTSEEEAAAEALAEMALYVKGLHPRDEIDPGEEDKEEEE